MSMRRELKFRMHKNRMHLVERFLLSSETYFIRKYPKRTINSIYFDNIKLDSVFENLSGIAMREKIRFRWYGEAKVPKSGVLEKKIKQGYIGAKDLIHFDELESFKTYGDLKNIIKNSIDEQLKINFSKLYPVLKINYDRKYLSSVSDDIRITLDTNVSYFRVNSSTYLGREIPLHSDEEVLVEIKYNQDAEQTATGILDRFHSIMSRNSKYTRGMVRRT